MLNNNKKLVILIRFIVGFGILFQLLMILDITAVFSVISRADIKYLPVGIPIIIFIRILGGWQLTVAIKLYGLPLTTLQTFSINAIAAFYSFFIPSQFAGGAVKWYKLSQKKL